MADINSLPILSDDKEKTPLSEKDSANLADLADKVSVSSDKEFEGGDAGSDDASIVVDGNDVSRLIVDIRDDGDPSLTFRSIVLGTILSGLGATIVQLYYFKPVNVSVNTVFLLLISWCLGELKALASHPSHQSSISSTPGPFGLKEHAVASITASTAAYGSAAVLNFAVQRLYYDTKVEALTAVLATFSTATFGYGLVGILRPLTIYPGEMVYWLNLPNVAVFQALHFDTAANWKRLRVFWGAFTGMFVWEVFPAYIFPLLNGFSIPCLASQHAPEHAKDVITNIFGGAGANEGLGLLSLSFDWQYIGGYYLSIPLIQQANSWVGIAICYIAILGIYYSNTWNSLSFPMLSTSIFASNGSVYKQSAVFGKTYTLNETALEEIGLPALTGSNAWKNLCANLAIGALIAHCILFWGPYAKKNLKDGWNRTQPDPHYQAMLKYKEAPVWWYLVLLALSFFAGRRFPAWGYIVALLTGTIITPFSTLLYARMGNGIATNQLFKMIAGAIHPGKPVANLYFSMWSHDVVSTSIGLAGDLKMGQYLKIPPRVMFATQVYGTIIGVAVNYIVMISVVEERREILLDPKGNNVWSGQYLQRPYVIIPASLAIGVVPTTIQWFIAKRYPKIGPFQTDNIMLPIIYMFMAWMATGLSSYITTSIIVGILSQVWLRRYHTQWFKTFNYILAGGLDGGAQVMIFVLSFAVYGASGKPRPFPGWAGNPQVGNVDYCNGNGALD
ncbi:oligopeptide transporter [Flagelloscypha sp. PMI_526]|nr:oligopeptide transporter [Flagelloscypha sp. PMI_526]